LKIIRRSWDNPKTPIKAVGVRYTRTSSNYFIPRDVSSPSFNIRNDKNGTLQENFIMAKRKHRLKRMIAHNEFKYFITITLKEDLGDLSYSRIKQFFRKNEFGKYIIVPELTPKTKRLHFHCLVQKIPFEITEYKRKQGGQWKTGLHSEYISNLYGYSDIEEITTSFYDQEYFKVVNYLSKYLGKSPVYKNTYSRGLKKSFDAWDVMEFPKFYDKILPIDLYYK